MEKAKLVKRLQNNHTSLKIHQENRQEQGGPVQSRAVLEQAALVSVAWPWQCRDPNLASINDAKFLLFTMK